MSNLSSIMVTLLLFSLFVTGPVVYYTVLIGNVYDKYGVEVTQSTNTAVFSVTQDVIDMAKSLESNTTAMASGNLFTDFVGMLVSGLNTLKVMFGLTGIFTSIVDEFLVIMGLSGSGIPIAPVVLGIVLIIITAKILSIVLNRDV